MYRAFICDRGRVDSIDLVYSILNKPANADAYAVAFFFDLKTKQASIELYEKARMLFAFRLLSVTAGGFEPPTVGVEIRYSIQLNYAANF